MTAPFLLPAPPTPPDIASTRPPKSPWGRPCRPQDSADQPGLYLLRRDSHGAPDFTFREELTVTPVRTGREWTPGGRNGQWDIHYTLIHTTRPPHVLSGCLGLVTHGYTPPCRLGVPPLGKRWPKGLSQVDYPEPGGGGPSGKGGAGGVHPCRGTLQRCATVLRIRRQGVLGDLAGRKRQIRFAGVPGDGRSCYLYLYL